MLYNMYITYVYYIHMLYNIHIIQYQHPIKLTIIIHPNIKRLIFKMTQTNTQDFHIIKPHNNTISKLLNNIRNIVDSEQITKTQKLQYIDDIALHLDQFKYNNVPDNVQVNDRKLYTILKDNDDPELGLIATHPYEKQISYNRHLSIHNRRSPYLTFYPDMKHALFQVYQLLKLPDNDHKKLEINNNHFRIVEVDASSIIGRIVDLTSSHELLHKSLGNPLRAFDLLMTREVSVVGYVPRDAKVYNIYHLTHNTMVNGNKIDILDDLKNIEMKGRTRKDASEDFKNKLQHSYIIPCVMSLGKPIQNIRVSEKRNIYRKSFTQTGCIKHINSDDVFILSSRDRSMNKTIDDISIDDMIFNMSSINSINGETEKIFTFWMSDEDKQKYIVKHMNDMRNEMGNDIFVNGNDRDNKTRTIGDDTIRFFITFNNSRSNTGNMLNNIIRWVEYGHDEFGGLNFVTEDTDTKDDDTLILKFSENNSKLGLELRLSPHNEFKMFKLKMELFMYYNDVYKHINTFIMKTVQDDEICCKDNVDFIKLKL